MPKRVLDVGNCGVDHEAIRAMLEKSFGAEVLQADGPRDALPTLQAQTVDLVLVNRKLDQDYSDGLDIIRQIKADPQLTAVPCMLITNYVEHQQSAVKAGAEYGFGKKELYAPQTQQRLARFLKD
jgi:two-component system chemotaxis response regulator CheY